MSSFHTKPIYPKQQNIGMVLWATVCIIKTKSRQSTASPPYTPNLASQLAQLLPLLLDLECATSDPKMAAPLTMPMRNKHAAPTFNSAKPQELSRYFKDLELLIQHTKIATEEEKKKQVLQYVDFNTKQIWKTLPEFINNNRIYNEFKDAIFIHYLNATGDFVYFIRDMDLLIGEWQWLGINSTKDLSDYHLQFVAITTWLISKGQLRDLGAFQTPLLTVIMNCL